MRNPLSDTIVNIPPSGIRKFFDVVSEMKGAISLGVGEPDFDTPWHIREEGIYSLEKGRTFYTSNSGLKELRQEICHYLKRRQRLEYDPNTEVMVTVGGSEAIDIALRAMLNPGDEVLIPQPSYVSYVPCTVLAGGTPVIIELEEKDEFRLTPEKLLEKITPKTKVLILPFPNNPTGAIMNRTDLEAIAKVIEEKDLFVLSDEIYSELTYSGKHVSIAVTDKTEITLDTRSGIKILKLHVEGKTVSAVTVDMGSPLETEEIQWGGKYPFRSTKVSMGNPHLVTFVEDITQINLPEIGPELENHPLFPDRTNVEFAQIVSKDTIRMRVWERGSGITQACGTGACATAVAAFINGLTGRKSDVIMDGGTVTIEWDEISGHILMTGPATKVFDGEIEDKY